MKRSISLPILTILAAIALSPRPLFADKLRLQAAFTVAFAATPNSPPVAYCGGPALDYKIEAHGDGYSSLGALAFFLQKTVSAAGALHGCLALSTPDGDSLFATYDGSQGEPNANNFVTDGSGTLTFTGGTGLFKDAKGKATFTAVFSLGQAIGFYVIDGKLSASSDDY
jgi:hypothetical protein